MFGFSIQKLLVLIAILGAVWYGFKLIGRLDQARKAQTRVRDGKRPAARSWWPRRGNGGGDGEQVEAQDMAPCPRCKAYVPARGARACERPDCPYV